MSRNSEVLVGCDGSCLKNPGGATGWAWVASDGRWASASQPSGTNQIAELWGVLSVLRDFPDNPLAIQIDSEYAKKAATVWRESWKRNGWKNREGKKVSNLNLILAIDRQMSVREHPVRFIKVPGHDPDDRWPLNTAADRRARAAAEWTRQNDRGHRFGGIDEELAKRLVTSRSLGKVEVTAKPEMCPSCDTPINGGMCACAM